MKIYKLCDNKGFVIADSLDDAVRIASERGFIVNTVLGKLRVDSTREMIVKDLDDFTEM